ncbi:MAG: sensor histidine kinase [Xenococcaceae cyanobacterium]
MKLRSRLQKKMSQVWRQIDPSSLRGRLTVGIAAVSALGLGGVAIWTSLKMQHILVSTHKQNIQYIAARFPHHVEIYSDMMPLQTGMQKAIDKLTADKTLLWVELTDGTVAAQSAPLKIESNSTALLSVADITPIPEVQEVKGRYWLLCATSLEVNDVKLGKFYVAQDITGDQTMFLSLMRSLSIASLLSIGVMTVAIAFYVERSLQPLQRISQLTEKISAEQLGEAHINLENAPSEVKELAQTFDQMLVRLSEAWEHQRQLVSNVSHELRTPLTIVSGYLQSTLRRGDNLTQSQREGLEIAASEAQRTIQLMQDLLDLARADSGHMHFQLEPLVLNELVEEVAGMAKKYSDRRIDFQSIPHPIAVKADANRLKQVLLNLIDNAVKYSDSQQPITVKLDQQGEQAIIQVCDRGRGIPLKQQARIFERFYRVDEARGRATGGMGLGLSIVKTLVEGMGGSISVGSQLGQGSTFTVTFPAITPGDRYPSNS